MTYSLIQFASNENERDLIRARRQDEEELRRKMQTRKPSRKISREGDYLVVQVSCCCCCCCRSFQLLVVADVVVQVSCFSLMLLCRLCCSCKLLLLLLLSLSLLFM